MLKPTKFLKLNLASWILKPGFQDLKAFTLIRNTWISQPEFLGQWFHKKIFKSFNLNAIKCNIINPVAFSNSSPGDKNLMPYTFQNNHNLSRSMSWVSGSYLKNYKQNYYVYKKSQLLPISSILHIFLLGSNLGFMQIHSLNYR